MTLTVTYFFSFIVLDNLLILREEKHRSFLSLERNRPASTLSSKKRLMFDRLSRRDYKNYFPTKTICDLLFTLGLIFLETETRRKDLIMWIHRAVSGKPTNYFWGEVLCVYKPHKNLPAAFLVSLSWLGTSDGLVSSMFSRAFILIFCSFSSNSTLKKPAQ